MTLNSEAIRKVIKKHDKNTGGTKGVEVFEDAKKRSFYTHDQLDFLEAETTVR